MSTKLPETLEECHDLILEYVEKTDELESNIIYQRDIIEDLQEKIGILEDRIEDLL